MTESHMNTEVPLAASNLSEKAPDVVMKSGREAGFGRFALILIGAVGVFIAANSAFSSPFSFFQIPRISSIYLVVMLFLSAAFIATPAVASARSKVPLYDWILVALTVVATGYFANAGLTISAKTWETGGGPPLAIVASVVLVCLAFEGVRRCGGWVLFAITLFFGAYPLFAHLLPGFLWGLNFNLIETFLRHAVGSESIVGIPMRVSADYIIGYILFGVVLTLTGGGDFFMNLSLALMGRRRGGPAKVAILSSATMGSLSGSVISNILVTGRITIPIMKRTGYPPHYAAAVEACASTGGTLMPPIMGTVAFIMASFLGIEYGQVVMAALLPALLFYIALLFQVDCHAARHNLGAIEAEHLPGVVKTLKEGWPFILSFAVLVWLLVSVRIERQAPYIAALLMIVICVLDPRRNFRLKDLGDIFLDLAKSVGLIVGALAGIGMIVGGLSYTGVAAAFSRELLLLAGDNILLMLIAGALTSFILGMGMTVSACYIFLSILLAPALVKSGLNPIASHLFILYWGMLSYITPPVAFASITAASIAGSPPLKTGLYSMRVGIVLFVLPFLFVLQPELILVGNPGDVVWAALSAIVAMMTLASALENHLYGFGRMVFVPRALLFFTTTALLVPGKLSDAVGLSGLILVYVVSFLIRRAQSGRAAQEAATMRTSTETLRADNLGKGKYQ